MKTLIVSLILISNNSAFPSGTTIGNGFAPEQYLKAASLKASKTNEKLCTDIKGARLEKEKNEDICRLKEGAIKMKDLIEAASKNDKKK
ncbi:MAG: hypothetical protein ACXVLQ_12030 [Bacteriovorax sp.]